MILFEIVDESKLERRFCSTEALSADRMPSSMPPYVGLRHARDCLRFQEDTVSRAWNPKPPTERRALWRPTLGAATRKFTILFETADGSKLEPRFCSSLSTLPRRHSVYNVEVLITPLIHRYNVKAQEKIRTLSPKP